MSGEHTTERRPRRSRRERQPGNNYKHKAVKGSIDPEDAYKQLSKLTASQKVVAGHVALEIAKEHGTTKTDETNRWLEAAVESFKRASLESKLGGTACLLTLSEAELGMIQARAAESLLVSGRLPGPKVAQATQKLYLQEARRLAETRQLMLQTKQYEPAQDALGLMAELAVLVLCQRFALKEVGPESWFPYRASLYEDNANLVGSAKYNSAWDISIYTDVDGGKPQLDYRLQVKSSKNGSDRRPEDAPGISRVYINPDLLTDMDKGAPDAIVHILGQCETELSNPTPQYNSSRLDMQTERLLDILDRSSEVKQA